MLATIVRQQHLTGLDLDHDPDPYISFCIFLLQYSLALPITRLSCPARKATHLPRPQLQIEVEAFDFLFKRSSIAKLWLHTRIVAVTTIATTTRTMILGKAPRIARW